MSFANTITIQRLCALANLVLIATGVYFGVALFYQLVGDRVQPSQSSPRYALRSQAAQMNSVQPVGYYGPILDRDLFSIGKTPQTAAAPSVDLQNLEKTQLSLKLWGTVSGDPLEAYAVIEDTQRREQNLYRVGDTIQNAVVKMILRERIVLNVDGKDEVLSMEDMAQASPAIMAAHGRRPYAMPPVPRSAAEQRITLPRGMLEESFSDVNKLMTQIAISPHMEDGQSAGLSLSRIAPNSVFRRMGLRNGDVLTGVNGQQLLSAEDAMRMYESLKSSSDVQLQLKRRGQERTIRYNIR